jgi:hypothetical protein
MRFDLMTPSNVRKGVPRSDLKGIVRDARHFSSNCQCNNCWRNRAVVIFGGFEVVKVILALIECHTLVKHLKIDIFEFCVSTTRRAAHLSDVDLSQSIFRQPS